MHDREIVCISGKITGDPNYREKFNTAERILRDSYNFVVINPSKLPAGSPYDLYIWLSVAQINECDTVYLLPDWVDNPGTKIEKAYAEVIGKNIRYYNSDDGNRPDNADHCVVCDIIYKFVSVLVPVLVPAGTRINGNIYEHSYASRSIFTGVILTCRGVKNKPTKLVFSLVGLMVGAGGFGPPKAVPADLQSVPFGHSGTLPYSVVLRLGGMLQKCYP